MSFQEEFLSSALTTGRRKIHKVQQSSNDVLQQAEALPFWSQDYTQLDKGAFNGTVASVSYRGIQIFRENMNRAVDQLASAPSDCYVIGLPTIVDNDSSWGLLPVRENSLLSLDKNAELLFRTSHLSEITMAVISAQRLEEYAAQVEWLDLRKVMDRVKPVESAHISVAERLHNALIGGLDHIGKMDDNADIEQIWRHFEDDLLASCVTALIQTQENPNRHHDQRIHRYIVNRVRELTLSSYGYPLTIGELCTTLRISRRTLNHAFARVLGITPVAYMRNLRLHRVRAELQTSAYQVSTIANIASKWGFWHMSLFSRYYRELFGECPNETLERSRKLSH
jgi:AraC family transcriptional regulator, ethanolamine operon transcriptional activator